MSSFNAKPRGIFFLSMRELTQSPVVLILIEDETALYQIGEKRIFEIAVDQAKNSEFQPEIKVVCPKYIYQKNTYLSKITIEVMVYEKIDILLEELRSKFEVIIFHNASRPLVPKKIYNQGIRMLLQGIDAVKQQHVVVDTLKRVNEAKIIQETIDRDLVKAVTTPEFYWSDSILDVSKEFGWFYEIKNQDNKAYIFGELESTRVRSKRDLFLVNALIEQGRLN